MKKMMMTSFTSSAASWAIEKNQFKSGIFQQVNVHFAARPEKGLYVSERPARATMKTLKITFVFRFYLKMRILQK